RFNRNRSGVTETLQAFEEGHGPILVMLGGGTFGAAAFVPHAKLLSPHFRVVRLQTLNVETAETQQPLPRNYSVKLESGAMANALDALGITAPANVVGWSYGGLIALDFALDHPDRVRALALFEPPAYWVVTPEELRTSPDLKAIYELGTEFDQSNDPTD